MLYDREVHPRTLQVSTLYRQRENNMILRRLCNVCFLVYGKRSTAVSSYQQFAKYSRNVGHGDTEIEQEVDYRGNVTWLQYIINTDGEKYLANLSEEKKMEKQQLELLIDVWRAEGQKRIPDSLTTNDWKILLRDKNSIEEKLFYLHLVWKRQDVYKSYNEKNKQIIKSISRPCDDKDLNMIQKTMSMQKHLNQWSGIQSLQHGRHLVIDMDYELSDHETFTTFQQVEAMYKLNCQHFQPCHLHFTSAHKNQLMKRMLSMGRNMLADFYVENLIEVFPKERLFYLVPEGHEIPEGYLNEDTIFVLGGMGGTKQRRRSFAKAISLGVPYGCIPLHRYVSLRKRSTVDLYLPLVMKILLHRFTGDSWKKALDCHLPDALFEKYPNLKGPVSDKKGMKSHKQFSKLYQILDSPIK